MGFVQVEEGNRLLGDWKIKKYQKFFNDRRTGWSVIIDEYNTLKIEGSVIHALGYLHFLEIPHLTRGKGLKSFIRSLF